MLVTHQQTKGLQAPPPGLVRTISKLSKFQTTTTLTGSGMTISPSAPLFLSKSGLPVLPVKKLSPEAIAKLKDREEQAKVKVKVVNYAEERLKQKEENEKRILKEDYRRKQNIMKEI